MTGRKITPPGGLWRAPGLLGLALALAFMAAARAPAAAPDAGASTPEFFETRVRPVLADHCYRCHSRRAEKLKGNLRLDDREAMLAGGENGPAVVPGQPGRSRLIEAVTWENPDLRMPPKTRLSAGQVADLRRWVEAGAPWPGGAAAPAPPGPSAGAAAFDLRVRRAAHWAWRPVSPVPPPDVKDRDWPGGTIDRFVLARLEAAGLHPAADCDRRTLIRRAAFVITGLPPSPEEVEAFVAEAGPRAFETVVDRLLASPRFGERWARHWMDLVRYSDTLGNEADAPIPNAWQYRDYLIRAFNADLPFDQFLTEHLAGDLLEHPRLHPTEGFNESVIGTGFFWMNEGKRSPVDVRQAQAECFDNKIDVLCKTFLGLTVACARCHDHKFDAISQRDYYALYGYLDSSRYTQAALNRAELDAAADRLAAARSRLRQAAAAALAAPASGVSGSLRAAAPPGARGPWAAALRAAAADEGHPMYPWVRMAELGPDAPSEAFARRWREVVDRVNRRAAAAAASRRREGDVELADFGGAGGYAGWFVEDQAFGPAPCRPGDFLPGAAVERPVLTLFRGGAWAHSGYLSRRLQGTLRSPTVTLDHRYLHVFAAGRAARVNVNVEHFVMIQSPLYERLRWVVNDDGPRWHTFDLNAWQGRRAYLEFADTTTPDLHDMAPAGVGAEGYVAVGRALLSDRPDAPARIDPPAGRVVTDGPAVGSTGELADAFQRAASDSLAALGRGDLVASPQAEGRASLLAWMIESGLLDLPGGSDDDPARRDVAAALKEFRDAEARLPAPRRAPAMTEGTAQDECVFIRGNHKTPGPLVARRAPEALAGDAQPPPPATGSGRLELARRLTDPSDPFVPRVMVNRVWHHVFGRGIVATPDNFGALGEAPTHPELLDFLAAGFVREHWSVKGLVREMVLSRTFRMSSEAGDAAAERADPEDRLLHRMPIRRLEGEAIRDAMLAVSGRLDLTTSGPGVEVYLTPEMQSYTTDYGKPASGGPLDGGGRRSVYLRVRRNFLTPLMTVFDTPPPLNTVGRRNVSNVPAQALALMNDPFVAGQARVWAERVLARPGAGPAARVHRMYLEAFARPPTEAELSDTLAFLDEQGRALGVPPSRRDVDPDLWAALAHVLLNVKEFIFLN